MKASTEYRMTHKKDFGHEKLEVLYEDQWLVVVNKPSGMLSCPYPGSHARTAQSVLEEIMRKKGELNSHHKPLVVHRLDRDTSGVMMFALTETAQKKIMDTWHQMVTERLYHAVAENPSDLKRILPDSGLIDEDMAFNAYNVGFVPKKGDRPSRSADKDDSVYGKHLGGKGKNLEFKTVHARTHYRVVLRGKTHTLFELSLDTGKKNQIRAHLASKGYPLAGDENFFAHSDPFMRLALHARTLEFDHPFTGEHMIFEVPEDSSWSDYVKKGDLHPAVPVWQKNNPHAHKNSGYDNNRGNGRSSNRNEGPAPGDLRKTGRQTRHMDFIQKGKLSR